MSFVWGTVSDFKSLITSQSYLKEDVAEDLLLDDALNILRCYKLFGKDYIENKINDRFTI